MLDETKLFDFIKILFTRPSQYNKIKNHSKKRHHFMINRFFAIKYPTNAQAFNLNGINPNGVIDSWQLVGTRFRAVPSWIYTKTKRAKKKAVNKKEYIPKEETIKIFINLNEIGMREYKDLEKFNKEQLHLYLKKLEANISVLV